MAEEERPTNAVAATFPPPPHFYQSFTTENIERINELRAAEEAKNGEKSTKLVESTSITLLTRSLNLPSELRFLQPPLPSADGSYRNFKTKHLLNEPLPSLPDGIDQLYQTPPKSPSGTDNLHDISFILKKLTKSLLLNFMELMGVMSINPALGDGKLKDIKTHFVNIHHLLNQYRPHEERESLIMLMEEQVEKAKAETEGIYAMKMKVEDVLDGLKEMKIPEMESVPTVVTNAVPKEKVENGYDAWDELSKAFD